jgi:nucleoid DNA-binding protein
MSSTELIQKMVHEFNTLEQEEKMELLDILLKHLTNSVKQDEVDNSAK